ncbi:MAG: MBL fold metallo-hydrolase, partial [Spirochaetaceae bacterium]|nr:MBL fold metallo-hydrolase [Spirochaetaceae bacterium]
MKLYFEGAAGNVTGSCSRLEYSCGEEKAQILVDCGLLQEAEEGAITVPDWSFEPSQIHAVLLTHAHIDHCGALPLLYNRGF